MPRWLAQANAYTERWFGVTLSGDNVLGVIDDAKADLARAATQVAHAGALVLGLLVEVLTIASFTFYLVADGPRFRRTICVSERSCIGPWRTNRGLPRGDSGHSTDVRRRDDGWLIAYAAREVDRRWIGLSPFCARARRAGGVAWRSLAATK